MTKEASGAVNSGVQISRLDHSPGGKAQNAKLHMTFTLPAVTDGGGEAWCHHFGRPLWLIGPGPRDDCWVGPAADRKLLDSLHVPKDPGWAGATNADWQAVLVA